MGDRTMSRVITKYDKRIKHSSIKKYLKWVEADSRTIEPLDMIPDEITSLYNSNPNCKKMAGYISFEGYTEATIKTIFALSKGGKAAITPARHQPYVASWRLR